MNFSTYSRGINFIIPFFYIFILWFFVFSYQIQFIEADNNDDGNKNCKCIPFSYYFINKSM